MAKKRTLTIQGIEIQLQNLVDKTIATYGRIDIIVNNAATNNKYFMSFSLL